MRRQKYCADCTKNNYGATRYDAVLMPLYVRTSDRFNRGRFVPLIDKVDTGRKYSDGEPEISTHKAYWCPVCKAIKWDYVYSSSYKKTKAYSNGAAD